MSEHFDGSVDEVISDPKVKDWLKKPFKVLSPGTTFIDELLKALSESKDSEKK